jgi:general secretion pathway protein D
LKRAWKETLLATAAMAALTLAGCGTTPKPPEEPAQPEATGAQAALPGGGKRIVMERSQRPAGTAEEPPEQAGPTGEPTAGPAGGADAGPAAGPRYRQPEGAPGAPGPGTRGGGGTQLSFIESDIATVVASVLGEALGQEYVIDPRVKGTMTLQSTGSVAGSDLFAALEAALRLQDVAMIATPTGYRIVPIRDAPRQVASIRTPESKGLPGYGIEVVPLQYASAVEMEKVLQPLAAPGSVLRVDEARNLLLIAGTTQERATLIDVIRVFDTDPMGGMSFAWFQLEHVEAKALASELQDVLASVRSSLVSVVRIVPMARLNSVLAASPQGQYLDELRAWVKRLDVPGSTPDRRIYVYDIQNGKAGEIAEALRAVLGEGAAATPAAAAAAPGPMPTSTDTGRRDVGAPSSSAWQAGGMRVVPSDENNSLLILATPTEYTVVESALRKLDVAPRQVLIEASLAEVTLNDQLRFGVQWFSEFGQGNVTLSQANNGGLGSVFPGFSYVYTGSTRVDAVLNALETITDVKVVSSPKLVVLNNHEAQLQVGDQVPIVTQSSVGVTNPGAPIVNTVQMRDTGVILRVTPRVNKGGLVIMEVSQEISDVVPTTTSGIDSPTIQQRLLTSTVAVQSGQTVALGGLIRETKSDNRSGLPWFQRIPLLGRLFGASDIGTRRTELIILLTPRVVRDLGDTKELTDYLREQFRDIKPVLE